MKSVLRVLLKGEKGVVAAELVVMVLALVIMLAAVTLNVIVRSFNLPLPDLSEPALVSMAVLAFIGSAYAVHTGGHISVDLGEMIASAKSRRWVAWLVDLAVVTLSVLILVYGSPFLAYVVSIGEGTPGLGLPLALPVGCLIGGAALSILHVACRYARTVAGEDHRRATMDSEPVAAIPSEEKPTWR